MRPFPRPSQSLRCRHIYSKLSPVVICTTLDAQVGVVSIEAVAGGLFKVVIILESDDVFWQPFGRGAAFAVPGSINYLPSARSVPLLISAFDIMSDLCLQGSDVGMGEINRSSVSARYLNYSLRARVCRSWSNRR